jgi:hypothetical protein
MPGSISHADALQNCALECSLRRINRKCKHVPGDAVCWQCRYYVGRYVNADPRDLKLYYMQSDMDAGMLKNHARPNHFAYIFAIGFCIFSGIIDYSSRTSGIYHSYNAPTASVQAGTTQYQTIANTLNKVSTDLRRKVDVNGDRLTNCIDAAVLFYQYYPDKDKVCTELNKNNSTGMNHLFNCVLIDGNWRAIEPQAYYTRNKSYWMRDVWGNKYDLSLNRDVTSDYLKFVK